MKEPKANKNGRFSKEPYYRFYGAYHEAVKQLDDAEYGEIMIAIHKYLGEGIDTDEFTSDKLKNYWTILRVFCIKDAISNNKKSNPHFGGNDNYCCYYETMCHFVTKVGVAAGEEYKDPGLAGRYIRLMNEYCLYGKEPDIPMEIKSIDDSPITYLWNIWGDFLRKGG